MSSSAMATVNLANWRAVMPEEDHAAYRTAGYGGRTSPGHRPALLIVDMTYQFVGLRASLAESVRRYPSSSGETAWAAVDVTARLLLAARTGGRPVYYTSPGATAAMAAAMPRRQKHPNATAQPPDATEIVAEISARPDEVVLPKVKPSGFFATPLAALLTYQGVDTVVVAGGTTSGCVRATVTDAFSYGYRVLVVEDAVFDRGRLSHAVSLFEMDQKYADVVSSAVAVPYLLGSVDRVGDAPSPPSTFRLEARP